MHWWITSVPNLACASAAARNTREFVERLLAVLDEGRAERPCAAQLAQQQVDARFLAQRQIGHSGDRRIEQFRHRALMHRRILPDIEPGEMEAETIHGPAQRPQAPARNHARIVRDQRTVEHVEIGLEFLHARIGRGLADRTPGRLDLELHRRRRQPGIDAGHRETIRFAASMRRGVGRAPGQCTQFFGDVGKMRRQRQFGAERVQLLQIEVHHPARLQPQGAAHHVGRDERVAVAVAADPASHGQERGQFARRAALLLVQPVFQRAMQPRHLMQERVVVE